MKEKNFTDCLAETPPLFMNFSGVYDGCEGAMDFSDIPGTNGYCDDAASEEIRRRIVDIPHQGIHFLDSGNYHYLSFFWLEKIKEDFSLILIDHHPDFQPPAFGDILSCGGWVRYAWEHLPHLKSVYMIDADKGLLDDLGDLPTNVVTYSRGEIYEAPTFGILPLYLSIDKDVLSTEEVQTDWDQGDMRFSELLQILEIIYEKSPYSEFLGIDICGEIRENRTQGERSDDINYRLLRFLYEKAS